MRLHDTDTTGKIHFSNTLKLYEDTFIEMLREKGISPKDVDELDFPVVEVYSTFLGPARFDDLLYVDCEIIHFKSKSITTSHEIFNQDRKLLAKGTITRVVIDRKTQKAIPIPDFILKIINDTQ